MANHKRKRPKTYRSKRGSWKVWKAGKAYKHRNKQALKKARRNGKYDSLMLENHRENEPTY